MKFLKKLDLNFLKKLSTKLKNKIKKCKNSNPKISIPESTTTKEPEDNKKNTIYEN